MRLTYQIKNLAGHEVAHIGEDGELTVLDSEFESLAPTLPPELDSFSCSEEDGVHITRIEPVSFESRRWRYIVELNDWLTQRGYHIMGVKVE